MTPITTDMTTKSMVTRLAHSGYQTLEDCARVGNQELLRINSLGWTTLSRLRKECKQRGIIWFKSDEEKGRLAKLKQALLKTYGMSEESADLCCEVYFTEGWKL